MKTVLGLVFFLGLSSSAVSVSQWFGLKPGYWGPWTDWSVCSKSCGGGTKVRRRECVNPVRRPDLPEFILKVYREHTRRNCLGADADYIACNTQQCYSTVNSLTTRQDAILARAIQCSKFNGTRFNGYVFNWVPYLRAQDSKECELNCMAKGHRFFLRLLPKVQDGTPCLTDPSKVCVDGKCQEFSGPCAGPDCYAKPVKQRKQRRFGVFTSKDIASGHLVLGYNPIITIPAGATDINVTEIHKSTNYLALKSHSSNKYYINGNWVIDLPKAYEVADTTVMYKRPYREQTDNEALIAKGPTSEDLDVMLLYQNEEPNIMYSYYLPKDFPRKPSAVPQPAEPNRRTPVPQLLSQGGGGGSNNGNPWQNRAGQAIHQWRVNGFRSCSHSCAGGTQVTLIQCVKTNEGAVVDDARCPQAAKPVPRQRMCNLQPCPPRWEYESWGQCTKTCGHGLQIRNVRCKQTVDNNGVQEEELLHISQCPTWERPNPTRECNLGECPQLANWTVGEWSECSVTCDRGTQRRSLTCTDVNQRELDTAYCAAITQPARARACNLGSCKTHWFTSAAWSKCSSDCGVGEQKRLVFCGRKVGDSVPEGHCSNARKPETTKQCDNGECQSVWVTGGWGECSVNCGNGTQTRVVFCAGLVGGMYQEFPDEACPRNSRPPNQQKCEKDSCLSTWFTSEWKECSRSCGSGSQSRTVLCMNSNGQHSDSCESRERPVHWRKCNDRACPVEYKQPHNCENNYSKSICHYVVQADFCKYPHYGKMCCDSCSKRRRRRRH